MNDPYAGRPSVLRRLLPSLVWGIVGVGFAVAAVFLFGFGKDRPGNTLYLVVGVPVIIAGYVITVVVASLVAAPRIDRARGLAGTRLAFVARGNRFLTSALDRLAEPGSPPANGSVVYAAADDRALTLWQGRPARKLAEVPWTAVTVVETTVSSVSGRTLPALRIVMTADGVSTPMLLIAPVSGHLGVATTPETRWIASRLDALRGPPV